MSLIVENLSRRTRRGWDFRDVSFEAKDGEVFGLFGDSGATLASFASALAGEGAGVSGSVVSEKPVACIPPSSPPDSERTKGFLASLFHTKPTQRRDLLSQVLDSEGPICLNEPFAFMSEHERVSLSCSLREAARDLGIPIVIATADFRSILACCDRAACLVKGYVAHEGTPQEIYDRPGSVAVAELTGRINLIEARRLSSSKTEIPEFATIAGGHRLFAEKTDISRLGAINRNVFLAIRPEQIEISFGASFPEDNLIRASITDVLPNGSHVLMSLDAGGIELIAAVPRLVGIGIGEECMVSLPPERIRILT